MNELALNNDFVEKWKSYLSKDFDKDNPYTNIIVNILVIGSPLYKSINGSYIKMSESE